MAPNSVLKQVIFNPIFLGALLLKLILACFFASHIVTQYYLPFIKHFATHIGSNPWDYFYALGQIKNFPYPPLMLIIVSLPHIVWNSISNLDMNTISSLNLLLIRLPVLFFDVLILLILASWFKDKINKVLWLYWCSPILIYINYYHGQLDVIPTALFLLTLFYLFSKKYFFAFLVLALALTTKGHIIIVLPFLAVYLWKQGLSYQKIAALFLLITVIYGIIVSPVILSNGYLNMVIKASEQGNIFVLRYPYHLDGNGLNLLLAPAAMFIILMRFVAYEKLNRDIAILYFALVFIVLVLLAPPMPGWYYWSYPLLVYFFIRNPKVTYFPILTFSFFYLLYFLTYQGSDLFEAWSLVNPEVTKLLPSVVIIQHLQFGERLIADALFTLLQSSVAIIGYWIFREGIHSNEIYEVKSHPQLIGIGGDSGTGKDTTLQFLSGLYDQERVLSISGDDYHRWPRGHQEWKVYTHLDVMGNKLHAQLSDAIALRDGNSIEKVTYDHSTGQFTKPQKINPNNVVFMVGLHPFFLDHMRTIYDLKIFLDPDTDLAKSWKIKRDMTDRGYTAEQVLQNIASRQKDADKYIQPQKQFADMVIRFQPQGTINLLKPDENASYSTKLLLTLNNSYNLEPLLNEFSNISELTVQYWHPDDLQRQCLEFNGIIKSVTIQDIANRTIPNLYEILSTHPGWRDNYEGIIQIVFATIFSQIQRLKKEDRK